MDCPSCPGYKMGLEAQMREVCFASAGRIGIQHDSQRLHACKAGGFPLHACKASRELMPASAHPGSAWAAHAATESHKALHDIPSCAVHWGHVLNLQLPPPIGWKALLQKGANAL